MSTAAAATWVPTPGRSGGRDPGYLQAARGAAEMLAVPVDWFIPEARGLESGHPET